MAGLAGGLGDEFGLDRGDRVAIVMRNRPEYLEALFAVRPQDRLAQATVNRIRTRHSAVVPEPAKRPKSSSIRFQAELTQLR